MQLTERQRRIITQVVNAFETGSPEGDYAATAIFHDGPHNIRQITYGRSQSTEYSSLRELVAAYVDAGGMFSEALRPYADRIGSVPLTDDAGFKSLLRRAGREDPVMRQIQDAFFDRRYLLPTLGWAADEGFSLPLSALVIYDSWIHSGGILWVLRQTFPDNPPSLGGEEKLWTQAYVTARRTWLAGHARAIIRKTVYRPDCFQREIARNNWHLSEGPIDANGALVNVL